MSSKPYRSSVVFPQKESKTTPDNQGKPVDSNKACADYQPRPEVLGSSRQRTARVSGTGHMVNGLTNGQENGLSSKGPLPLFEEIIQQTNHGNSTNGGRDKSLSDAPAEPILAFESEEPFMKKASPMKPQHVAGPVRFSPGGALGHHKGSKRRDSSSGASGASMARHIHCPDPDSNTRHSGGPRRRRGDAR
ncbi:hypothetical protein CRUP_034203 [Coryphaenoides rupestris]|nr:hypothetical protein CRUP_034203 [Coryphaenoides rupestris]